MLNASFAGFDVSLDFPSLALYLKVPEVEDVYLCFFRASVDWVRVQDSLAISH